MIRQRKRLLSRVIPPASLFLASVSSLEGSVDAGGEGVSDLWELRYGGVLPSAELDEDGDGASNFAEGIAGTDPHDRRSVLGLDLSFSAEGDLRCEWVAMPGKAYQVQRWDREGEVWESVVAVPPAILDGPQSLLIPFPEPAVFRLQVSDVDFDGDGLSAWEEIELGFSDDDPVSAALTGENDFMAALRRLESPEGVLTSDGVRLPQRLPGEKGAARFLMKSSFGPTDESIARVMELGYAGWVDEQFSLPTLKLGTAMWQNGLSWSATLARHGWWRVANLAEDQLRQRVAYALSPILVVNLEPGSWVGNNPLVQAKYYDIFTEGAFGPYRDVLEDVTYSPVMGWYLSHLKNRKTDDPENPSRFPDENFAREIMQLFTIGLWELNPDGTRKLDEEGRFIPTYDNGTITEMAKIFTGMAFSTTNNGRAATSFYDTYAGNDFLYPMKVWDEEHEPGPKSIINGVELDGTQTGEEEVQATLDALMTHDAMAPFLSRLLIQRLTSSNPSPGYLARVSEVWSRNRNSDEHLGEVVKAILLDPEVLNDASDKPYAGKVREPVIRFTSLARAFGFATPTGQKYTVNVPQWIDEFGQYPMMAPTVFNFYSPNFAPNAEFASAGMVSPEMELSSMSQHLDLDSRFSLTIYQGGYGQGEMDFSKELLLADDPEALLDRVDLLLTGGRLAPETRANILTAIEADPQPLSRVKAVIYLVSQSMECVVVH